MKKEEVAPILRKWLPVYLNDNTSKEDKMLAEKELLKVYSQERKEKEVAKYYNKYLAKYLKYENISREDCLKAVDAAIIQTAKSNKVKSQLIDTDISQLEDGYIANKFEMVLNPNIGTSLKDFIAKENDTTKYTLNILRKIDEKGHDIFSNDLQEEKEIIELLKGYSDGQNKKTTVKPEDLLYKLKRTFSDEYSYLREFIERNRTGLSREEQKELQNRIIDVFSDSEEVEKVFASLHVALSDIDMTVFNKYFLATNNITLSEFEKQNNIKNVRSYVSKLHDVFLHI